MRYFEVYAWTECPFCVHAKELLIEKDYEVHGTIRRSSSINTEKIDHLIAQYQGNKLFLYYSDLLDSSSLTNLISNIKPNEVII